MDSRQKFPGARGFLRKRLDNDRWELFAERGASSFSVGFYSRPSQAVSTWFIQLGAPFTDDARRECIRVTPIEEQHRRATVLAKER